MPTKLLFPAALLLATASALAAPPQADSKDAAVTRQVKAAIGRTPGLGNLDIQVTTVGGVVRLSGNVPGGVQVDQAEDVASRVSGVKEVNNKLRPAHDS